MTNSLLNLDPDQLLTNYSVEEVENVARRLQREVDTKREELRVMVGERYRDLIEAADTIQTMKTSSLSVIQSVSEMQSSGINLQKHSLTYTVPRYTENGPTGANLPYLSVAASIKLLMVVPERIWEAVESEKLSQGAALYLLAQHVHTGLQGDQGGGITPERIRQWFPVISRQCATINNFYQGIIHSAKEQLTTVDLEVDRAVDALSALVLLKGLSAEETLDTFLRLRNECLNQGKIRAGSESARSSVCTYIRAVICTVQCVYKLFMENSPLQQYIELISGTNSEPSINLIGNSSLGGMMRYLPEPVLNYKPRLSNPYQSLQSKIVVGKMLHWMEKAQENGQEACRLLLEDISTLQGVAGVRQGIWILLQEYLPYTDWDSAVQSVCQSKVDLWESFYREVLRKRLETLISSSLQKHLDSLHDAFKEKCVDCDSELNLGNYIWSESSSDLSSLWNRGEGEAGLSLKCRGWSLVVKSLCDEFDNNLSSLWNDIVNYNKEDGKDPGPFDRYSDSGAVLNYFRERLTARLAEFVDKVQSGEEEESRSAVTLLLARSLQSLPVLVKTLRISLSGIKDDRLGTLLMDNSSQVFWRWTEGLLRDFRSDLEKFSLKDVLMVLPAWDNLSIQESGENCNVDSIIRIPNTPSIQFSAALKNLSTRFHKAHPAPLPLSILLRVSRTVLETILSVFFSLVADKIPQNIALQMAFNARFVEIMFMAREYKEELSPAVSQLIEKIEFNIDPFDLSVFSGHLETRVKRCCARELTSLCPLVPQDRVQIISSFKHSGTSQDVSNIMNLNTSPPSRFQLLPLSSVGVQEQTLRPALRIEKPTALDIKKTAALLQDKSPVAAAAASFFGSMGSSWFGSGS